MAKKSLSGFPEWLPEDRLIEQHILDLLRHHFELHGFSNIETRGVETLEQLESKGETSKEIYLLERLQSVRNRSGNDQPSGRTLGLHFDLTVPLSRYVVENASELNFPFRRYQMQKVWRGERPQEGRFREFTQADIDIIGEGTLGFHHEIETAIVMLEALNALPIPPVLMLVNNRKIVEGFCRGKRINDVDSALRSLDKLDKVGTSGVEAELSENGFSSEQIESLLALAAIESADADDLRQRIQALAVSNDLLDEGLTELSELLSRVGEAAPGQVVAALKIARGLDYYTGTVYETVLPGYAEFGSICSGGRYDALAVDGKRRYPGVGLSIGVSRLLSLILSVPLATVSRKVPTVVLVAVNSEESRRDSEKVASALRSRGIATEVSPTAAKYGKQIRYADKRGIPYVWFCSEDDAVDSIKDIRSGQQFQAEASSWPIPEADLRPLVEAAN